ncbi:[protein-PII] uridylyltransferase [soil metagenome]
MPPAPIADSNNKPDPAYSQELKRRLEAARNIVRENNLKIPGLEIARQYSDAVEELLSWHMDETAKKVGREDMRGRMALVATGGFGRKELGLHSDIDFTFITERSPNADEEAFIKAALYPLWDLRVDLGYGVHSMKDCLAALGVDLEKTTSFLETRHVWGDSALSEELQERVHGKLHKHFTLWFVESLKEELLSRHHRNGDTVFLLEPDVKNSRGGLRDIHEILWIAFANYGESSFRTLVENQIISVSEVERLREAWSFLIDVRNTLHILQNRRMDKLTLERQVQVAKEMGFAASETALAEESLMRRYYDHALIVERLSQRLLKVTLESTAGTRESLLEVAPPRQIERDFWTRGTHLWIEPRDIAAVEKDRFWQLRLFLCAAREGLEPGEDTLRSVEQQLNRVDDSYRKSPTSRDLFLSILRTPGHIAATLRHMHRCGFLAAYLPEFAPVTNLPRIDHYHQFTVDEHLIRSVGVSEELLDQAPPHLMDHASGAAKEVLRPDLLNFALLIHDVGKGEGRGHVIRGMHAIQRIAERMNLRPIEQEILRKLVANHQKMSHMALRRDIDDPSLPRELADAVGDPELLRMLYVHTACDVRAVSEQSWNEWRGKLLALLFEKTLDQLRGIRNDRATRTPTNHLHEQIWEKLEESGEAKGSDEGELAHFLSDMPERYLRSASAGDAAHHFLLSKKLSDARRIVFRTDVYENSKYVELTFVARSAPGLFSMLCGALASKRFNILSAQIYTAHSGEAVDIFQVEVPVALRADIDAVLERLCERIERSLQTGQKHEWLKNIDKPTMPITQDRLNLRPPRVDINNSMSTTHSVIEVRAPDRPGLLSEMAAIFDLHGINIDLAFIATESYQIVDVFYVTDLETNKLNDKGRMESVKKDLLSSIHAQIATA